MGRAGGRPQLRGLVLLCLLGACGGEKRVPPPAPPASDAVVVEVREARGGGLAIRFGERETGDIAELARWLTGAKPTGRLELYVEHTVDDDDLKELVERLDEAGLACDVVFTSDPAQRLPFPDRPGR